jgi:peptidyl-prolyl cis-trans isomerase SurA
MKFLNLRLLFLGLLMPLGLFAQEIIPDVVVQQTFVKDTLKNSKRLKIDGIIATVGDYIILDSDIDLTLIELAQNGAQVDFTRCQILGKLMEDKLYAHHAIQDSIPVSDAEIMGEMDEKISVMMEQIGSMEKLIKYYNKKNEDEFRSFFFDILKLNKLTASMQKKIVDDVTITPEEVRTFFKNIPVDERPVIGAEVEVSQIVIQPKVSDEEKLKVINRLKEIRREVLEEGASFTSKAVLNSQDPGSRSTGGFYKMTRKTPFVKEFKDVAFSLAEGEISMPFETEFGYHIIYLERILGQELHLRHILLMPRVTDAALKEARENAALIRKRIMDKEITFEEAARSFSDEKETRANGGVLLNPRSLDKRFELTRMDPELYRQVSNLKEGEISMPLIDEDQRGIKRFKLITVKYRSDEHVADYSRDFARIKEFALKEKQIKAIAKWSNEKINETYIRINGEYKNCQFENNWLKK